MNLNASAPRLLNYSTTISAHKTVGEIQAMLARAGASAVMCEYDKGEVTGIAFRIQGPFGELSFLLPAKVDRVHALLKRHASQRRIPRVAAAEEQARRVAWRILKDWIEAQLALVQTEMVSLDQVLLPFAQCNDGTPLYERMRAQQFKALNP